MMKLSYVLITAARNEETFIEKTIQSVIAQRLLPKKWIIVSDGSTDRTDDIVKEYTKKYEWIELLRMPEHPQRNFAAKAHCVNAAREAMRDIQCDLIGNLDADISFEEDFFEFLLKKFSETPELGVAGARYTEHGHLRAHSLKDVAGQCQLFRSECFEQIGGYIPSKHGGIDNIAVLTARMKGWKTQTFNEIAFLHHRIMSTAETSRWKAMMKHGREDYLLGNHPLWEIFRIVYQSAQKPYVIGGVMLMYGYIRAVLIRVERPVSDEFVSFYRKVQMKRLKAIIRNLLKGKIGLEET